MSLALVSKLPRAAKPGWRFDPLPSRFIELAQDLSHAETWTYLLVLRKTWGFGKRSDAIPLSQIAKTVGCSRKHAGRVVLRLEELGLLRITHEIRKTSVYECLPPAPKVRG